MGAGLAVFMMAVAVSFGKVVARVNRSPSDALGRHVMSDLRSRLIWIASRRGAAPLAAWCFARLLVTYRAGQGFLTVSPTSWSRWDSVNYMSIAQHGYTFERCTESIKSLPGHPNAVWCGTAGWFPGYPLLLRIIGWFGAPTAEAGAALAAVLLLATYVVLWNGFLVEIGWHRAIVLLVLAASFPGVVYGFAVFPMSLVSLALVSAFLAARHEKHLLMVTGVGAAVFAYPSTAVLIPIVAAYLAWLPASSGLARLKRASLAAVCATPLLVVGLWHAVSVGHWNAFVIIQRQLGPLQDPLKSMWTLVVTRKSAIQTLPGNRSLGVWLAWQTTATVLILVMASVATIGSWMVIEGSKTTMKGFRRYAVDRFEAFALASVLGMWLFTLTSSNGAGPYRSVFALLPGIVLLRRAPLPVLWVITGTCVIVTYGLSAYFFGIGGTGLI